MADLSITGEVVVTSEKAEGAFDRVGAKAGQMASKVQAEATKAGAAVDSIGAGAEQGAEKFTRAESRMRSAIQKSTRELEMLGKTASQKFEAQLEFKGLDKAKFQPFLDELRKAEEATKKAESGLSGLGSAAQAAGRAMAVAFSGAAAFGVVGKLVEVQREFDVLNSSLKTVTGSSAAAERELSWLKTFAKETPFGLAQATQGFVKMKALGLDPTRAALTSFGNTASAMGKDLNQMIEAVADASTGEFERLKEFGIKAKKEGDNVSLTFQGVTTTIKNSASEITKYLEDIGNVQFGGAMAERAKTLDGAISELGDTWDELFRTINERNAGTLIYDSIKLANGAIEDATTIIKAMTAAYDESGQATGAMATIQNGIATAFETVAVLGANLKYVLVQIGNEIGGLAAQVVQAAQFNFAGVRAIREQMVANAEAARREIDATTERILNARKEQEEYARWATRNASAATDPRRVDLGGGTTRAAGGASSGAAKAAKEAISEYDKLIKKLSDELPAASAAAEAAQHGYNKSQEEFIALAGSPVWAGFTNQQRAQVAALFENRIASEQAADAAKTLSKANLDAAASREKYLASLSTGLDKIKADTAAQLEATARMGMSKEAIAELDAAKLEMLATDLELQAIKAMDRNLDEQTYNALKQQAEAYRELAAAKKAGATKEMALDLEKADREAAKKAADEWERAADDINRSLTDALLRGFESGKDFAKNLRDTVINMFKTMVLRPVISAIVNPIAGSVTSALGFSGTANAATAPSGVDVVGAISNGMSMLNTGISSAVQGTFSKFALSETGKSLGLSMAGPDASGYNMLSGTGQQMSQALGVVGDTLAGYAMGSMARSLISNGYSAGKGMDTFQKVGIAVGSAIGGPLVGAIIGAGAGAFNQLFGRKLKDSGIQGTFGGTAGFDGEKYEFYKGGWFRSNKTKTSPLDQATTDSLTQQFRAIQLSTGLMAETLGLASGAVASFTKDIKLSFKGLTEEQIQKKMAAEFTAISDEMAGQVLGTMQSEYAKANETASQTLTRLATSLITVNSAFELLGVAMLDASLASGDMASRLIEQSGGGEAFAANLGTYYENFYDQAEKTAYVTEQVTAALASVGLQMPKTREEFRALVESQIALGDSGTQAVAALLGVSGAFASVVPSAAEATAALQAQAEAMEGLQIKLLRAQGNEVAAVAMERQKELAALQQFGPAAVAMQQQIYGIIDAAAQAEAMEGLQIKLLRAQGNEVAAVAMERQKELAALQQFGPAAVAMQQQTYGIIDAAAQAEAALAAMNSSAAAYFSGVDKQQATQDYTTQGDAALDKFFGTASAAAGSAAISAAQASSDAARTAAASWRSAAKSIESAIENIRAGTTEHMDPAARYTLTKATLDAYTESALSGDVDAASKLAGAADDFLKASESGSVSQAQYLRDRVLAEAKLASVLSSTQAQASVQDAIAASASAAVDQLAAMNANLTGFSAQVYELLSKSYQGADRATAGAAAAGLAAMQANFESYFRDTAIGQVDQQLGGKGYLTRIGDDVGSYTSASGDVSYFRAGESALALAKRIPDFRELWEKEFGLKLPAYAVGTNYVPQTGPALLHEGEAVIPKAFNPWAGGGQGNGEMLAELRALRRTNERLEARLASIEASNRDMATLLDNVTEGGNAMRSEVMA